MWVNNEKKIKKIFHLKVARIEMSSLNAHNILLCRWTFHDTFRHPRRQSRSNTLPGCPSKWIGNKPCHDDCPQHWASMADGQHMIMSWQCFLQYRPFVRGNHQSLVDSPHKRPVMWSFDAFSVVCLTEPRNKQSSCWWSVMPWWWFDLCHDAHVMSQWRVELKAKHAAWRQ